MGGPYFFSARSTISIARSTPAQKPRGWARTTRIMGLVLPTGGIWHAGPGATMPRLAGWHKTSGCGNAVSGRAESATQLCDLRTHDRASHPFLRLLDRVIGSGSGT